MFNFKNFDISTYIDGEFDYSSVSQELPRIVSESNKIIKLRVSDSEPFYVFSEETLLSLIENILLTEGHAASFFDGMESFKSGEIIGMEALDNIEPRAPEYDKKTAKSLLDKTKPR